MILLQSKDVFEDILLLDSLSGMVRELKRSDAPEFTEVPINGTFVYLGGRRLMFYRLGTVLQFQIDGDNVVIDTDVESKLERKGKTCLFRVLKGEKELLHFEYRVEDLEKAIPGDTTAFIDEEDSDFCQFVHNVLNNPQRRSFIYQIT